MEYQTINYLTVDLTVGFKVEGKYYPATLEDPAEYAEINIIEVKAKDSEIDLLPMLTEDQEDEIYNLLQDFFYE